MSFFDWIRGKSERSENSVVEAPVAKTRPNVPPPEIDAIDVEELQQPDEHGELQLDELFITIDYKDASGKESRRRITLLKAARGPQAPILTAICHERHALRHFRVDRIECFIDMDGEVFETKSFIQETLLIDLNAFTSTASAKKAKKGIDPGLQRAREIREILRAPLSLLVLAALADDEFHICELEVICCYIEDELWARDIDVTADELNALTGLVRKMHPTSRSIGTHYDKVLRLDDDGFRRFQSALRELIAADGIISSTEEAFLADLAAARRMI
ncbi:hypothetical protein [Shimia aestuarii]|uniref:WYL domain-containing protein n=1 Tax=Shimia aestuarii TaxID=254406 RepID=UPI001FB22161|nr:hypothetical protein [Shimia aestuarii]